MGLKEEMISNFKGYEIEYQGKKLYVVEQLEYKGDTYLCVIHLDKLPETVINFLKRKNATKYENVEDNEIFNELFNKMGENKIVDEIKSILNEIK